jgi:hypothetical protein
MAVMFRRKQKRTNIEVFPVREHDTDLSGGWNSLFAATDPKPRPRFSQETVSMDSPYRSSEYWRDDHSVAPQDVAFQGLLKAAHRALAEAKERGETYSLEHATSEDMISMSRAVGIYGLTLAEESATMPEKVSFALVQLRDATAEKQELNPDSAALQVDTATFILTAASLAKMREASQSANNAVLAGAALNSLRDAGDLELVRHQEEVGQHTGEIALAAILEYQPAR